MISIHAPLAGSDKVVRKLEDCGIKFLSTLPSRGATNSTNEITHKINISIHAPLAGSD